MCLSGGGCRAMLFHVGAILRLNELGMLDGRAMLQDLPPDDKRAAFHFQCDQCADRIAGADVRSVSGRLSRGDDQKFEDRIGGGRLRISFSRDHRRRNFRSPWGIGEISFHSSPGLTSCHN